MCLSSPANIATMQWSIGLERNPVFGASRQLMRNRLNRLQTRSEAGDGGLVPLEFAIRQVGDVEVSDPAECRASELGADICFSGVRCNKEKCRRSEEHTSELQSLMRISYAVFCLKKKIHN